MKAKELVIHEADLPVCIRYVGTTGKTKPYVVKRARKVFGLCLNVLERSRKRLLGRSERK